MRKKQFSDFSFPIFFSDFERKIFQTFGQKTSKSCQNYLLRVQRNSLWLEIFFSSFESFWIFCTNLWHGSQNSIYVSRVKIAEETVFLFFFSEFFSDFDRKIFQTFGRETSRICQNYLLRVQRNNLWLDFFLSFESFPIFCRNHSHGSQNSIYESRLKIAQKNCFFLFSSQNFFDFWAKNFQTFGQIFEKLWKLPSACPQEQLVASKFFKKFWTVLDFLQKPLAWFSNFYLHVQSKNCGRNSFLIFLFRIFSDFERKFFQTFGEKTSKSCQNYLLRVQRNSLWLEIFFLKFWMVLDFLHKPSAWFSKIYLRVQS